MAAPCKSTAVVDGQFHAPYRTGFTLTKSHTRKGAEFEVTCSTDGAAVMQVETAHIGYRDLRSLRFLDAASRRPVIAVEQFGKGDLRRWEAFRGEGTSVSDRLFVAVDKTRFFQWGFTVHVFLDGNSSGDRAPNFVVHGSYYLGAMTVSCDGKDIAQIGRKKSIRKEGEGDAPDPVEKNMYTVWIEPGVDQALVLALTVIVDQMYEYAYCVCSCDHVRGHLRTRKVQRH